MEWTEDLDHSLCQEILALEPFKAKKGSIARERIWDQITSNLNSLEIPRFRVTKRSVRERYTLLIEKLKKKEKKKLKEEEKASGIETDMNTVERALEEILEKEADAENTQATDRKRVDNVKAVEMRNGAMESMRSTQKRKQGDQGKDVPKPKITRRSDGDTVAYLSEKNVMVQKWKAEELEMHKQRLEVESRKQDEFQKQQQAMMQTMAQQQQPFQMFAAMQQQQTQVIFQLLEKQTK